MRASNAGGADPTPSTRGFTIDATAPAPPVISAPGDDSWSSSGTIALSGTAEASSTVELFDGATSRGVVTASGQGAWSKTVSGVPDGSHVYTATASDAAGNTSAASAGRTVTVDTVAPETVVSAGPLGTTAKTSATIAFAGYADAVSFQCALDGAPFAACSPPLTLSALSYGSHTFEVRARDAAGNIDATPASRTWSVAPSWTGPVTVAGDVAAGGSLSSAEVRSSDPLAVDVTTPVAGPVSATISTTSEIPPSGYSLLGLQAQITAPQATTSDPLVLTFRLRGSPLAAPAAGVAVFRDGAVVADCTGAGATPDPCVASRVVSGDDLVIVARTSTASLWNLGRQLAPAQPAVAPAIPAVAPATPAVAALAPATPPPAPVPVIKPLVKQAALKASDLITLPSNRRCVSRRNLRIRIRKLKGVTVVSATVTVNGRRVRVVRGKRLRAPVDLRGLPSGRLTVRVKVKTSAGATVTAARRYRACAPKRARTRVAGTRRG